MTWKLNEFGWKMGLSVDIPDLISRNIRPFCSSLLGPHLESESCDWAIHPGGAAILKGLEGELGLSKSQTTATWNTLRDYGNMSSGTLLFVLKELAEMGSERENTVALAFGPGLSIEGALLRNMAVKRSLQPEQ